MRNFSLALLGAGALSFASLASASITVSPVTTTTATGGVSTVQQNTATSFQFDTITPNATTTAATDFMTSLTFNNSSAATVFFTIGNAGGTITLAQLISGTPSVMQTFTGSGSVLGFSTFLNPGDYQLNYSGSLAAGGADASGNAKSIDAAVPEPATWGLMLLGFGGMGVSMRRSRKRVIAQIA